MKTSFKNKKKGNSFISGFSILSLLVLPFILIGCGEQKVPEINLNDYVNIETVGYNGFSEITVDIDYEAVILDYITDESVASDTIDIANTFEPFTAKYKKDDALENGDEIKIKWDRNEDAVLVLEEALNRKFVSNDYKYTIEGLEDAEDYNPFDDLQMKTNGTASGSGVIDFSIQHKVNGGSDFVWKVEHSGENGALKNGDTVHLKIADEIDENEFTKKTGLKIIKKEMDYTIDCLCVPAFDDGVFKKIAASSKRNFDLVIEEWVLAGLNDEHVRDYEPRAGINIGYKFYTNATDANSSQKDGMFFAIYKITDEYVPEPYYVFIGIKGDFTTDHQRLYINGKEFSDSFVDYEKETVRYSEKFGWGQGQEGMGFLVNGVSFAGHQEIQETLDYIEKTFGNNYANSFESSSLQKFVLETAAKTAE